MRMFFVQLRIALSSACARRPAHGLGCARASVEVLANLGEHVPRGLAVVGATTGTGRGRGRAAGAAAEEDAAAIDAREPRVAKARTGRMTGEATRLGAGAPSSLAALVRRSTAG